jgi:hypothetical protein
MGSLDVAKFEQFENGLYLDYYNGDMVDHINRYETRIYLICKNDTTVTFPTFQRLKNSYQAHFQLFTKYVC